MKNFFIITIVEIALTFLSLVVLITLIPTGIYLYALGLNEQLYHWSLQRDKPPEYRTKKKIKYCVSQYQ